MNFSILVTGADGFIGSHLVESLVKDGYKVRAFCFYNSQGSLVMNKTNLNLSNSIYVAGLSSGIYFVKLTDNKNLLAVKKLLIK